MRVKTATHARMLSLLLLCLFAAAPALAQDAKYTATTADPAISVDHLAIMVEPLSKAQLEVEAAAWFELLQANAHKIAETRMGAKKAIFVDLNLISDRAYAARLFEALIPLGIRWF